MGFDQEVGIVQVQDLARMPVQLDQVRALDLAQVRPGEALVNPEQRLERVERLAVNMASNSLHNRNQVMRTALPCRSKTNIDDTPPTQLNSISSWSPDKGWNN